MAMVKTPIEIDQDALSVAAEVLGTTTKKDTVNAALREVGQRLVRLRALAGSGRWPTAGTSMTSWAIRLLTVGDTSPLSH